MVMLKMDNPCFDDDVRKGVYTIERLPDCAAKSKGQRTPRSKVVTLVAALLLGTIIVLITTAALVYTLRSVHTNYRSSPATTSSWASELIVSGEFKILNEPFRSSLYNLFSPDFKQLSKRIENELELLFANSVLWAEMQGVAVTSFSPGLQVRCSLALQPKDSLTIGKIGLAFIRGLNHSRGHPWLGPFTIDVLSIGFQARTEEVSWSQWSDWSDCMLFGADELVRTRRRVCLSLDGLKLSRSEPCQAISKQDTNDIEFQPCITTTPPPTLPTAEMISSIYEGLARVDNNPPNTTQATTTSFKTTLETTTTPSTTTTTERIELPTTTTSTTTTTKPTTTHSTPLSLTSTITEPGGCSLCTVGEVCLALEGDSVPICRAIIDQTDPTGCGGLCQLGTEICHRLAQGAFRCVDDSKCLDTEWQCGNSLCIPLIKRCDGHFNCYDHTDESNCDCDLNTHFQCGKNLSCLPRTKRCDGIVDCWDAADESNCTIACLDETQFTCNDSQCIPSKNFCDGFVDCKDHSDEPFGCGGVCKNHEWRCSNGRCIVKRDVCNGHDDCGDNSDEMKCGKRRGGNI
nr:sortilin-related receptor isoform X2 [Halyomorpha halys]